MEGGDPPAAPLRIPSVKRRNDDLMPTQSGHLVLADISGYTSFVADTELEHSREILNELLETIVRCLAEHLAIGQIEGDAIFALGDRLPPDPAAWLQDCF